MLKTITFVSFDVNVSASVTALVGYWIYYLDIYDTNVRKCKIKDLPTLPRFQKIHPLLNGERIIPDVNLNPMITSH